MRREGDHEPSQPWSLDLKTLPRLSICNRRHNYEKNSRAIWRSSIQLFKEIPIRFLTEPRAKALRAGCLDWQHSLKGWSKSFYRGRWSTKTSLSWQSHGDNYTEIALQIGLFGITPTPNEINVMLVWMNIFIISTYKTT